jgi:uncharacterized protein YcbK (DUF882 family)
LERPFSLGERMPDTREAEAVGAIRRPVTRTSKEFRELTRCEGLEVIFKDEEGTGADRMMSRRLSDALLRLGTLVGRRWPGVRVRVTEAWDERHEHSASSLHYEGRAADITTSDLDPAKLGYLATLAVQAGCDWVYYEDRSHVHVSVRR